MARILIVGGDDRGLRLAASLLQAGYPVRIVSGADSSRGIQRHVPGAERFTADPERPGTLKAALEHVSVACWLFGSTSDTAPGVNLLNGRHLESFLHHTVDSSVRGIVYEAAGRAGAATLTTGTNLAKVFARLHAIPLALITADPLKRDAWLVDAREAIARILDAGTLGSARTASASESRAHPITS
jgi:hypothetical protein